MIIVTCGEQFIIHHRSGDPVIIHNWLQDCENVGFTHDEVLFAIDSDFRTGIFAIQHRIAYLNR
jgi:hypothetical protein